MISGLDWFGLVVFVMQVSQLAEGTLCYVNTEQIRDETTFLRPSTKSWRALPFNIFAELQSMHVS